MTRQKILEFALDELNRLATANGRILAELPAMRRRATDRVLQSSLLEQETANARIGLELEKIHGMLVHERHIHEDALLLDFCKEARLAVQVQDPAVRDLRIARAAVCMDHWQLAVYTGLASMFRQLYQDEVADALERCIELLQRADDHIEALRPSLTGLHRDEERHGHDTRSPEQRAPRYQLLGYALTGGRGG